MRIVWEFASFWWDFLIGDDWRVAGGVVAVLSLGATAVVLGAPSSVVALAVGSGLVATFAAVMLLVGVDEPARLNARSVRRRPSRDVMALVALIAAVAILVVTQRLNGPREDPVGPTALVPTPSGPLLPVPTFRHAFVIVFENQSEDRVFVSPDEAPTFIALRDRFASLEAYQGIAHPSQPNYMAMIAGSQLGIVDNEPIDVDGQTILDQLEATGRDWRVFAENVPPGCFLGSAASGGRDGDGDYARKHNPAISLRSVQSDPVRCAKIQDFTAINPGSAEFQLIIPNRCHAAHDCPLGSADAWLKGFLPRLMATPAYTDGGVIFVLFDESDASPENIVPAIVISEDVVPGIHSAVPHNHYSLLRTLQESWALPCLAASCGANTVGEVFAE